MATAVAAADNGRNDLFAVNRSQRPAALRGRLILPKRPAAVGAEWRDWRESPGRGPRPGTGLAARRFRS